jgi:hypothetical protein
MYDEAQNFQVAESGETLRHYSHGITFVDYALSLLRDDHHNVKDEQRGLYFPSPLDSPHDYV